MASTLKIELVVRLGERQAEEWADRWRGLYLTAGHKALARVLLGKSPEDAVKRRAA
ncbi:MAG: hypothetical protein ACM3US_01165 [Sphingomonadaceae bacterium]